MQGKSSNRIRVVLMVPSPLTPRWMSNFCIDALANVFDVEYWDCGAICAIKFDASKVLERPYVYTIHTLQDLENNLNRLPADAVMFSHIHLEADNYKVHKLIAKYNPYRVCINFWANAITENTKLLPERQVSDAEGSMVHYEKVGLLKKLKRFLFKSRVFLYLGKYIRYKGDYRFKQLVSIDRQMRMIRKQVALYKHEFIIDVRPGGDYSINHPDFEKYITLVQSEQPPLIAGKYIVFLDQNFPYHPHLKTENPSVDFDALVEPYFNSLNRFFDKLEDTYKCKVVIAGHPTAQLNGEKPFGTREVICFKTAELVKDSKAVCLHSSYSVSFAFLFDKPFCLLTNKAVRQSSNQSAALRNYSRAFEHPIIDTDDIDDVSGVFIPTKREIRDGYNNLFFDMKNHKLNTDLLVENVERIHNKILEDLSL